MKKNIFISCALIVLAVLAGCTPQSNYPAYPVSATITQTGDFIKGDALDSSKFQVVVTYLDGSTKTLENVALSSTVDAEKGVQGGETVSVNVGTDINGKLVAATGSISRVYTISELAVKATTTSFEITSNNYLTDGQNLDSSLFEVTATYGNTTSVLPADAYTVSMTAAEAMEAKDFVTASEVPSVAKVTLVKYTDSKATAEIAVTATKDAGTLPSGVIEDVVKIRSVDFQFPQFAYTELPAIDPATVTMNVKTDAEESDDVTADQIEGIEFAYINADGNIVDPSIDKIDMSGKTAGQPSGIKLQATWKGKVFTSDIYVAETKIKLEYKGNGYLEGTMLNDIDLSLDDFRATLFIGGKIAAFDPALTADNLKFVDTAADAKMPKANDAHSAGQYVTVDYKGVTTANITKALVYSTAKADVKLASIDVEVLDTINAPAKMYYSANSFTAVDKNSLKVTANWTDGSKTAVASGEFNATWYYDQKTALADIEADDNGAYDLGSVDSIYVLVAYGATAEGAKMATVKLAEATPTAVVLAASYEDATPAIGDTITWNVMIQANGGYIYNGPVAQLGTAYGAVSYFQDGKPVNAFPTAVTAEEQTGFQIKVGDLVSAVATADDGTAWVEVTTGFTVAQADTYKAYYDEAISTTATDYTLATTGYDVHGSVAAANLPKITKVTPVIPGAKVVPGSTVDVTVSYQGKNGTETKVVKNVAITGIAWVEISGSSTPTLAIGEVGSISTTMGNNTQIPAGTYSISEDFVTNLVEHRSEITWSAQFFGTTAGASLNGDTFTIPAGASCDLAVTYLPKDAEEPTTITFYVTGVQVPEA